MSGTTQHNFGEKKSELYNKEQLEVYFTDKFNQSRKKACEMIDSNKFGLEDGDFWILKNKAGTKLAYTGLIISHQGCQKINDHLDENLRFNQCYCSSAKPYSYNGKEGMLMEYRDERDGCFEIGEISPENCKNPYNHAMLLKRTFDRVVLFKSKLKFYGIYSEEEAEEFARPVAETDTVKPAPEKKSAAKSEDNITSEAVPQSKLEKVLDYKLRGTNHTGECMRDWISNCKPNMQVALVQEISKLKDNNNDFDKQAAEIVLQAIKERKISFPKE